MTDSTSGAATPDEAAGQADADAKTEPTPPWGSDEEFNPERAWSLIQNLRGELATTKEKAAAAADLEAKVREYEDAKLSDEERNTRDLEEAREKTAALATENALLRAAVEHGLSDEDLELLQDVPAEAIPERAAKLAARLGAGTPPKPPAARPSEALRGGADPTTPTKSGDWLREALNATDS
ncbi:MAG TPA: hypothetical protein VK053_18600 [Jiangellaceae bacterium]|nr:hypothetical protein [Jiangellaceae bacterium]